jgi:putative hydrolase of the HAD superfamily
VLARLRAGGHRLAVCSNWDWDLAEAMDEAGLGGAVDVMVSSAWAGARKPHPRIYRYTLLRLSEGGITPRNDQVLFVGDTWGPDVEGPLAMGMTPLYLERPDHWPDPSAPDGRTLAQHEPPEPAAWSNVRRARDLTAVFDVL